MNIDFSQLFGLQSQTTRNKPAPTSRFELPPPDSEPTAPATTGAKSAGSGAPDPHHMTLGQMHDYLDKLEDAGSISHDDRMKMDSAAYTWQGSFSDPSFTSYYSKHPDEIEVDQVKALRDQAQFATSGTMRSEYERLADELEAVSQKNVLDQTA